MTPSSLRFVLPATLALAAAGLVGCAPRQTAPTTIAATTQVSAVSFYPQETGLNWGYLPEGDTSQDMPYTLKTLGPTLFQGQQVLASQLTGRGAEQTWYRNVDSSGIKLYGLHKPGVNIGLSPAWQEAPAPTAWKVGLHWEGSSQITIADDAGKVQAQGILNYSYDVQDYRQVKTPAGTFMVWVVTRQMTDTVGGLFPAAQQYWFTPYVGEIRSPEGLLLVSKNFASPGSKSGGK